MPRKRSVSGRSRPVTPQSKLMLEIERANRKFRRLEKGGEYGKFAQKKLLRLVTADDNFSYSRSRRNKIRVRNMKQLKIPDIRIYLKKFGTFLKAATSSPLGIKRARSAAEKKLKRTLGGLIDRKLSNEDIDEFYELVTDEDFKYIADKIGDSDVYVLVQKAKEKELTKEEFTDQFKQFMSTNNAEFQLKARKLYNKIMNIDEII